MRVYGEVGNSAAGDSELVQTENAIATDLTQAESKYFLSGLANFCHTYFNVPKMLIVITLHLQEHWSDKTVLYET